MDLHLAKFLTSNDPPPQEIISEVHGLLVGPLQELAKTESEVESLLTRLNQLNAKHNELNQSIDEYRTIISPIRQLTDDALQEIFLHCLSSHRNPIMSASEAPVLLTRVCSRWRSVALSSPRLWAQIHITFCDDYRYGVSPQFSNDSTEGGQHDDRRLRAHKVLARRNDAIKQWLLRSGNCPLSMSIYYTSSLWNHDGFSTSDEQDPTVQLFKTILSVAHRLRSLELTMAVEIYRTLGSLISSDSLPTLTALKVNFYHQLPTSSEPQPEPIALFKAPRLERLSLIGLSAHPLRGTSAVPFTDHGQRLTYFSSHIGFSFIEALHLLKQCGNLVHCRLWLVRNYEINILLNQVHEVFLPHLCSLSTDLDDNNYPISSTQFYSAIDAPHLKWLEYLNQPSSDQEDELGLSFLPLLRKSTELRKLTIDPWCFRQEGLRRIFDSVSPTLMHLVLGDEHRLRFPNEVHDMQHDLAQISAPLFDIEFLIVDQNSEPDSKILLPRLETLESVAITIPDETILRIITSRMRGSLLHGCVAMKRINLFLHRAKQIDIEREVAQYQAAMIAENRPHSFNVKFDLRYIVYPLKASQDHLSMSYGLHDFGRSWIHHDLDELLIDE